MVAVTFVVLYAMLPQMSFEARQDAKLFRTLVTNVWRETFVDEGMFPQRLCLQKFLVAKFTDKPIFRVDGFFVTLPAE
jgi:hypothetical protein